MTTQAGGFRVNIAEPNRLRELEAQAPDELKEHFRLIKGGTAAVPIPGVSADAFYEAVTLRALALKPDIFYGLMLTEHRAMKGGEVESPLKELMAIAISEENEGGENRACAEYHVGAATFEGASQDDIRAVKSFAQRKHELPHNLRRPIEFGLKAAFRPKQVTDRDVQELKDLGYSDAGIIELIATAMITYNLTSLNRILNLREGFAPACSETVTRLA